MCPTRGWCTEISRCHKFHQPYMSLQIYMDPPNATKCRLHNAKPTYRIRQKQGQTSTNLSFRWLSYPHNLGWAGCEPERPCVSLKRMHSASGDVDRRSMYTVFTPTTYVRATYTAAQKMRLLSTTAIAIAYTRLRRSGRERASPLEQPLRPRCTPLNPFKLQ